MAKLELKKFDMSSLKTDKVIVFIGKEKQVNHF